MHYETNLYGGWWLMIALVGIAFALLLMSFGGIGIWLGLATLAALGVAAIMAMRRGYGPRQYLLTTLSAEGVAFLGHPHPPAGETADFFVPWTDITGISLQPKPGYWQTWMQASPQTENWFIAGNGAELAQNIADIAALIYATDQDYKSRLGKVHFWRQPDGVR